MKQTRRAEDYYILKRTESRRLLCARIPSVTTLCKIVYSFSNVPCACISGTCASVYVLTVHK